MTDVLVRDVPDEVLARIDDEAARLGLSRNAYLQREMQRIARHRTGRDATAQDLDRNKEALAVLKDADQAWQ